MTATGALLICSAQALGVLLVDRLTVVRKLLMWWLRLPGNPYVSVTGALDFTRARDYLDRIRLQPGREVTVHHLLAATVARVLHEFSNANARIFGGRIQRVPDVGIAMPVNLVGHDHEGTQELGLGVLEQAQARSLRDLAETCHRMVRQERTGRPHNPLLAGMTRFIDKAPYPVVAAGLGLIDLACRLPPVAEYLLEKVPVTTILSNPGAALGEVEGAMLRAIAFQLPQRLVNIGTLWAVSGIQDEVIPVDGAPAVRPVLPLILIFDHRLFDGVAAGRILARFAKILLDPTAVFGPNGHTSFR